LPNVVVIYVDDLGYGDVGAYGATAVQTPNIDRLAENGVKFTDAHCAAATCTPSRYALLTGRYAFRVKASVLPGDAPLLIRPGTPTIASMLKQQGYRTAVVGKWHLGLGNGEADWNGPVKPGPLQIGFDYSFIIPSTGDRVPSVYLENERVANLSPDDSLFISFTDDASEGNPFGGPTGLTHPEQLKQLADTQHAGSIVNGVSRIGFQTGGKSAEFVDEEMYQVLYDKAAKFIDENKESPFFLYFAFHDIHVPRVPNERFVGATDMGPRGDAIVQMDWVTGKLLEKLEALGIAENTLVIFSSDNGPVLDDGYADQSVTALGGHQPAGPLRGGKYSIYEAGTRVPTISYWPGTIAPGANGALWSQVDLFASLADLVGADLPAGAAPDSQPLLPVILGESDQGREVMLEEAFTFAVRQGKWKYIAPTEKPQPWISEVKNIEGGLSTSPQLYDLEKDLGEQHNLAGQYPEKVEELQQVLDTMLQ